MTKDKNKKQKIREEIQEVVDPAIELRDLLLRTQANFENYRKQTEIRIKEITQFAASGIILSILPVIDNFELALKNSNADFETFKQGVELIYAQLDTMLEDNGVKSIDTQNKTFDPYVHEALMKVESDKAENIVLEEFQRGFTLHGKVIRHAKVKVSSGVKKENNNKK